MTGGDRKQDEYIDKCEELDQANHDIQQMVIEASLQKSEMGDQIERMYIERRAIPNAYIRGRYRPKIHA